jgi:hypothetical protein
MYVYADYLGGFCEALWFLLREHLSGFVVCAFVFSLVLIIVAILDSGKGIEN